MGTMQLGELRQTESIRRLKLCLFQVWNEAAAQTFYTLSIGMGGLFTISSYSEFHTNILLDSFVVCLITCGRTKSSFMSETLCIELDFKAKCNK